VCVIDGGKGLREALDDVLGDTVLVQRCQVHKMRNLKEHLPEKRHAYVLKTMREAYAADSAAAARKRLQALLRWLDSNGEESAARSLKEGLEETLTVLKLNLPPTLRRCLATTNCVENFIGTHQERQALARGFHGSPLGRPRCRPRADAFPQDQGIPGSAGPRARPSRRRRPVA